jgi:hypothetical protein
MSIDIEQVTIVHNPSAQRFEAQVDSHLAVLEYRLSGQVIHFTHTGVPSELEGRGLGSRLAKAGLDYAKEQGYHVIPSCPFVAAYIQRHPIYQNLL